MSNIKQLKDLPRKDLPYEMREEMVYCPWLWQLVLDTQIQFIRLAITQLRMDSLIHHDFSKHRDVCIKPSSIKKLDEKQEVFTYPKDSYRIIAYGRS